MLRIITYLYTYRVSMHISSLIYPLESPYIISVYSEIAIRLLSFSSEVSAPKSQLRSLSSEVLELTRTLISIVLIFCYLLVHFPLIILINTDSFKDLCLTNGVRLIHNNLTECEN